MSNNSGNTSNNQSQFGHSYDVYGEQQPLGAPASGTRASYSAGHYGMDEKRGFFTPSKAFFGLLLMVAVIGGGVYMMGAGSSSQNADTPIVLADAEPIKVKPDSPGGLDIANRESTVFESLRSSSARSSRIENLLESSGQPMDKLEEFARQVENEYAEERANLASNGRALTPKGAQVNARDLQTLASASSAATPDLKALASKTGDIIIADISDLDAAKDEILARANALNGIDTAAGGDVEAVKAVSQDEPRRIASLSKPSAPAQKSGDTLAFVNSVLDDKSPSAVAGIEPAAGAGTSAGNFTKGTHFVQLASISDQSRGESEWGKLQKTYPSLLKSVSYRVKEANLSGRGTFYRIQAGPFTKEKASQICGTIKARKPGGCLVTQ